MSRGKAVGPSVLTTDGDAVQNPDEPTNLDFENQQLLAVAVTSSKKQIARKVAFSFLLHPKFQKVLDDDSAKWYTLYHDIAYSIWRPCSAASYGPRKRSDAGSMGGRDVHRRGGASDCLPKTQSKRNNHSYPNAPT